jgi:hypothetical protein
MIRLNEAKEICLQIGYRKGLEATLRNQAAILYEMGNAMEASKLLKESEKISRDIDYKEGLALSLINQAVIAYKDNCPELASSLAGEACDIVDKAGIKILSKKMQPIRNVMVSKKIAKLFIAFDGGHEGNVVNDSLEMITWVVKRQKQDKNS